MRRFDKEMPKGSTIQGIINRRIWAAMEERGQDRLYPPFMVYQRFEELARARMYGYRARAFRRSKADMHREYCAAMQCLVLVRRCDKPRLP